MNNYVSEFKKFINRGNVVDMSVGVIVGSAFTAIVTAMSNNILKPLVNYLLALIFDADSLSEVYTYLKIVYTDTLDDAGNVIGQEIDLANSIYIDWGAFINAVINFFVVIAAAVIHLSLPPVFSSSRFCSSRYQRLNLFRYSRYRTRKEEGIK